MDHPVCGRAPARRRHAGADRVGLNSGEVAGVGKSRLVWEFTRSHRTHGWLVLESGSISYGRATPCRLYERPSHPHRQSRHRGAHVGAKSRDHRRASRRCAAPDRRAVLPCRRLLPLGDYRATEHVCRRLMQSLHCQLPRERLGLVVSPAVMSRATVARALAERGVFDEEHAHGHEAIRIAEALDHPFSVVVGCLDLACLKSVRGELSQAARLLERLVGQCREWNITSHTPIALAALGTCTRGRDPLERASPACSRLWPPLNTRGSGFTTRSASRAWKTSLAHGNRGGRAAHGLFGVAARLRDHSCVHDGGSRRRHSRRAAACAGRRPDPRPGHSGLVCGGRSR